MFLKVNVSQILRKWNTNSFVSYSSIGFQFDNSMVNNFSSYDEFLSFVSPQKSSSPKMVAYSNQVASLLNLTETQMKSDEALSIFCGNFIPSGSQPMAACYGGHQFGVWAGQLGDGRAISLGEILNSTSERWEIQLKGCGKTPYSRFADGRAVLRSSIREYLASEGMHHLGIPTTRALCITTGGDWTLRDEFYTGNTKMEPTAIVTRVAPSFFRFGTLELPASRGNTTLLGKILDYTLNVHFPHLENEHENKYLGLFQEIIDRTAQLIALWTSVGFVHGVMNTDNMSLLGLTLDYGPFGFLEEYNLNYTPNLSDPQQRYSYKMQPTIAFWNLSKLAPCFLEFVSEEQLKDALSQYENIFQRHYQKLLLKKFGLVEWQDGDQEMIDQAMLMLAEHQMDYTNFFRKLGDSLLDWELGLGQLFQHKSKENIHLWEIWFHKYKSRLSDQNISLELIQKGMHQTNPKYILRNHMAHEVIKAAEKEDFAPLHQLEKVLSRPYDDQTDMDHYTASIPSSLKKKGIYQLSCSS